MKYIANIIMYLVITGCSSVVIKPAKVTYSYLPSEQLSSYPKEGIGALAMHDGGAINLYLPMFSDDLLIPKRFEFVEEEGRDNYLVERNDKDLIVKFILKEEMLSCPDNNSVEAMEDMLIVIFPNNKKYKTLSGHCLRLKPTISRGELMKIRGIYIDNEANFTDVLKN